MLTKGKMALDSLIQGVTLLIDCCVSSQYFLCMDRKMIDMLERKIDVDR